MLVLPTVNRTTLVDAILLLVKVNVASVFAFSVVFIVMFPLSVFNVTPVVFDVDWVIAPGVNRDIIFHVPLESALKYIADDDEDPPIVNGDPFVNTVLIVSPEDGVIVKVLPVRLCIHNSEPPRPLVLNRLITDAEDEQSKT